MTLHNRNGRESLVQVIGFSCAKINPLFTWWWRRSLNASFAKIPQHVVYDFVWQTRQAFISRVSCTQSNLIYSSWEWPASEEMSFSLASFEVLEIMVELAVVDEVVSWFAPVPVDVYSEIPLRIFLRNLSAAITNSSFHRLKVNGSATYLTVVKVKIDI